MTLRIRVEKLEKFIADLFDAKGVNKPQYQSVAHNIVWSELVGRTNYGVIRIPILMKRIEKGVLNRDCRPIFEDLSPSAARLDADNGFGHYAGEIAMSKAVALARQNGISVVSVCNSNFFGTGAYFVQQAASQGMIGFAMSNSFPKVAAYGGSTPVLGTNPFAFGAPRRIGRSLLVDFATSALAGSTVREYLAKGLSLPEGLAVSRDGKPLQDPGKIGEGTLLPFGGPKGYGLSLMVEILAGVLSGAGVSHGVKSTFTNFAQKSNSGHLFIAFDIGHWMNLNDFFNRFEAFIEILKASESSGNVRLPGEIRWKNYDTNMRNGILFSNERTAELECLSRQCGVELPG